MSVTLLSTYIILILLNLWYIFQKKDNRIVAAFTVLLLFILMSANHNVSVINGKTMDLFYYERDYYLVTSQNIQDSKLYYLFFASQYIANTFGLSYYSWLAITSGLCLSLLLLAVRKFDLCIHYVLFFFMYYVIALYAGLKYFYGMIPIIFGIYWLMKNKKLWFIVAVLIASGIHFMYFFFFVMLLIDNKYFKPKFVFRVCIGLMILVIAFGKSTFIRTISAFMYFALEDSLATRSIYFTEFTNLGFLIPIMLHLVTLLYANRYLKVVKRCFNDIALLSDARRLYSINQLCVFLYPLFLIAITFSRYITVVSLVTLFLSSNAIKKMPCRYKKVMFFYSFFVLLFFGFYFYYFQHYLDYNLVPFFTVGYW